MYDSAKRMYKPQTYHHIQEIQKYNIQDYRPRYVFHISPKCNHVLFIDEFHRLEWSNSKKPSAKCAKCNVCANNAATPSHKPTSHKQECFKRTIRREKGGGMVKWRAQGRRLRRLREDDCDNDRIGSCMMEYMDLFKLASPFCEYFVAFPERGLCQTYCTRGSFLAFCLLAVHIPEWTGNGCPALFRGTDEKLEL